jgi:anion-transporting  ArsA/GET3 family ATPase
MTKAMTTVDDQPLLDTRVVLVTGKGGVGKSSVAAALAVAGAQSGRRTGLVEVEGRQTFSKLFQTQAWDFEEREFRPGLWGLSIDPEASLTEYLEMFYGAKRISKLVVGSTAVEFATTAAPGIKDVLLIGKVKEMERRRDEDGRLHYDLIVVDSPPTGRIVNFLRAPDATTELVNVGPIRNQAQTLIDMLLDAERTKVVLVTLLEEMPVTETIEGVQALEELGVALGPVFANRVLAERFDGATRKAITDGLDPVTVRAVLADAGLELDEETAAALLHLGTEHLERLALQEEMREELTRKIPLPVIELPEILAESFGPDEIAELAEHAGQVL